MIDQPKQIPAQEKFLQYRNGAWGPRTNGHWGRLVDIPHVLSPTEVATTAASGVTTIADLIEKAKALDITDPVALRAAHAIMASVERTQLHKCAYIAYTVAQTVRRYDKSIDIEVVGECARSVPTVGTLELCMQLPSQINMDDLLKYIEDNSPAIVRKKDTDLVRLTVGDGFRDVPLCIHVTDKKNYQACVLFRTGPTSFISVLNDHLAHVGLELTSNGLKSITTGQNMPLVGTYGTIFQKLGLPHIPSYSREWVHSLHKDKSNLMTTQEQTVDCGMYVDEDADLDSVTRRVSNSEMVSITFLATGSSERDEQICLKMRELAKKSGAVSVGAIISKWSQASTRLVEEKKVDYLILEADTQDTLINTLLPKARKATNKIVVRNPLNYLHGIQGSCVTYDAHTLARTIARAGAKVDICGSTVYAGCPAYAMRELVGRCGATLSSADYSKQRVREAQANALVTASALGCNRSSVILTKDAWIKWLSE